MQLSGSAAGVGGFTSRGPRPACACYSRKTAGDGHGHRRWRCHLRGRRCRGRGRYAAAISQSLGTTRCATATARSRRRRGGRYDGACRGGGGSTHTPDGGRNRWRRAQEQQRSRGATQCDATRAEHAAGHVCGCRHHGECAGEEVFVTDRRAPCAALCRTRTAFHTSRDIARAHSIAVWCSQVAANGGTSDLSSIAHAPSCTCIMSGLRHATFSLYLTLLLAMTGGRNRRPLVGRATPTSPSRGVHSDINTPSPNSITAAAAAAAGVVFWRATPVCISGGAAGGRQLAGCRRRARLRAAASPCIAG